jgi:ABC-type sugar transport system ATPase subunit
MNNSILLQTKEITKLYPGVRALDNVDFDLRAGEVHLLIGENGAGKSTLGKIIVGFTEQTSGTILLNGQEIVFTDTKQALKHGIAAVYQEMSLVPHLSVAQNIFLNREHRNKLGFLDIKRMEKDTFILLKNLNCDYIRPHTMVKSLSVAERQIVEIAKALSHDPKVIVFDEPTGTLSEREVDSLFKQIEKLSANGIGIIYISHRMQEFRRIGDRVTVLRDGKKIDTCYLDSVTDQELVNMMVGREISTVYQRAKNPYVGTVLEVKGISDHNQKVKEVSFHADKGEIVGLCGLIGAGRTETAQLIFGIEEPASGEIYLHGKNVEKCDTAAMVKKGVGMVTEDRKMNGLAIRSSVKWNILSVSLGKYCPRFFLNHRKIISVAEKFKKKLRIAVPNIDRPCKFLSGGNQQKVVLAKWFAEDSDVLIFDEPTRGIDIGAKMEIYSLMNHLASSGKTIIMISSELPEIIGMSDRIYIMREGRIVDEVQRGAENFDADYIGAKMMGVDM